MFDFFISYGHDEAPAAFGIAERLTTLGETVWIDDPDNLRQAQAVVGIPAGEQHWTVIRDAIADAATFLVVDGRDWRESDYCLNELAEARKIGVRVAVVTDDPAHWDAEAVTLAVPGGEDALVAALAPGDQAAAARILIAAAAADDKPLGLADRWLGSGRLSEAARTVLASPGTALQPVAPDGLVVFAQQVHRAAQRRRRRWINGAVAGATAVALLAGASFVSFAAAGQDRLSAEADAGRARSLELAVQALAAQSTDEGRRLAEEALAVQDTREARTALAVRTAEQRAAAVMFLPEHDYREASFSPSGRRFALSYPSGVVFADIDGQVITDLGTDRFNATAFLDDDTALLVSRTTDATFTAVEKVMLNERGRRVPLATTSQIVQELRRAEDGTIWWEGHGHMGRFDPASDSFSTDAFRSPDAAVEIAGQALIRLGSDGVVERLELPLTLDQTPTWAVRLADLEALVPDTQGPDRSGDAQGARKADEAAGEAFGYQLKVCGDQIHVVTTHGYPQPDAHVALSLDGVPVSPFTFRHGIATMACLPSGDVWPGGILHTRLAALPSQAWAPHGFIAEGERQIPKRMIQSSDGSWTAVVLPSGEVRVVGSAPEQARTIGQAMQASALSGGASVVQLLDGSFWRVAPGQASVPVGRDDEPWHALGAAGPDLALVASTSEVGVMTPDGLGTRWARKADLTRARPTVAGDGFVLRSTTEVWRYTWDAPAGEPLRAPVLNEAETLGDVMLDGETLYVTTQHGRFLAVDAATGETRAETSLGVAGVSLLAPGADGPLVLTPDGALTSYDRSLAKQDSLWLGVRGTTLTWVPQQPKIAITTPDRTLVFDRSEFRITQRLAPDSATTVALTGDGQSVVSFTHYSLRRGDENVNAAAVMWPDTAASGVVPPLGEREYDTEASLVVSPLCADCG